MPLQKILFKPGVNRENTRYTTEGGWYECDKIRFRQGTPESLGGWAPVSLNTFTGLCRSLWNWVTLAGRNLMGVGTSQRFYVENGGALELEALVGAVVELGRITAVPTPTIDAIYAATTLLGQTLAAQRGRLRVEPLPG